MLIKMTGMAIWKFVFILSVLETSVNTHTFMQGHSHAFIPANNEVRYLVDGVPVSMHKEFSNTASVRISNLEDNGLYRSSGSHINDLKFEPPLLDFKERYLGMPHNEKVTLHNVNSNKTIQMSSISGNTVHFHSSFFEDKIIPPLGNTTFNVVFLGREEGKIESSLFIHTSEGSFKYQVKGASITSPYRLRPLVGIRMPLNSSFSSVIHMHNPHPYPIQVVEIYSSGGDLHLELPSGQLEGPKHLWEIPPFETKPVIKAKFFARIEKNHTAYVRVKVNNSEDYLVIPLEVEVSSDTGMYCPDDILDFGIMGSTDEPRKLKLLVLNSSPKSIQIQNVISTPVSRSIKIDFNPIKVPPDSKIPTEVATITFDPRHSVSSKHISGKIVVKGKSSQYKLTVPYISQVYEGGLHFNLSTTQFCTDTGFKIEVRNFSVTNKFKVPVVIYNLSLPKEAQPFFLIHNFSANILKPDESTELFQISLNKETVATDFQLESYLKLFTNISTVSIPLLCYNGRLIKFVPESEMEGIIDLGTVGSEQKKDVYFMVINSNPVDVRLKSWETNLLQGSVELLGVEEGNTSTLINRHNFSNMTKTLILKPHHYAVFHLEVTASTQEGVVNTDVFIDTQFEQIVLPIKMRVAKGNIEVVPRSPLFHNSFPGKLSSQDIHIHSSFDHAMKVINITAFPPDNKLYYRHEGTEPIINPHSTSFVGKLYFSPHSGSEEECYTGIPTTSQVGRKWLNGISLPHHVGDIDTAIVNNMYSLYLKASASSEWNKMVMKLDTNEVKGHVFSTKASMVWPQLFRRREVVFPLTQIRNESYQTLTVENPSDFPVLVQIVIDSLYPEASVVLSNIPKRLLPPNCYRSEVSHGIFAIVEERNKTDGADSESQSELEKLLLVKAHVNSTIMLLKPGEYRKVKLSFTPFSAVRSSSVIFIRNNLTALEAVCVSGRGGHAQFKLGNRKPGSTTPLLFELSEKHLKDCEKERVRKFTTSNLSVKRSFTARNTGELPLYISGFYINGLPCEGYGFRVLNCNPFELPANASKRIEIAFTPDFTLARIQRTLFIHTSLSLTPVINYTLIATLPPYVLVPCSNVVARPTWEPLLYYTAVSFMVFLLFCVLAAAFFESDRILKCTLIQMASAVNSSNVPFEKQRESESKLSTHKNEVKVKNDAESNGGSSDKHKANLNTSSNKLTLGNSWLEDKGDEVKENGTKFEEQEAETASSHTLKGKKRCSKRNSHSDSPYSEQDVATKKSDSKDNTAKKTEQQDVTVRKGWSSLFSRNASKEQPSAVKTQGKGGGDQKSVNTVYDYNSEVSNALKENKTPGKDAKSYLKYKKKSMPEVSLHEEETSSTSTESSNNEEVEKESDNCVNSEDSTKPHKKSSQKKGKIVAEGESCEEEEYDKDLYSKDIPNAAKSRSSTKVKMETTSMRSDVGLQQTNVELPYKLKPLKTTSRDKKDKLGPKQKAIEKPTKLRASLSCGSSRTPPPSWDHKLFSGESFSDVVSRYPPADRNSESPVLYSSVVSNSERPSIKTPIGRRSDSNSLGPIGQKPGFWVTETSSAEQSDSSIFSDSFSELPRPDKLSKVDDGLPFIGESNLAEISPLWEQKNSNIMKVLHEERRKRYEKYKRQNHNEAWPRFDTLPTTTESLWDSHLMFGPLPSQAEERSPASLWGSLVGGMSSVWPSSLWSAAPNLPVPDKKSDDEADVDKGLGFDPLRSVNNIWSPGSTDSSWSSPGKDTL